MISCSCWAGTTTRLCSVYCDKIWNDSNLRRVPRWGVSVVHFAIAIREILSREEVSKRKIVTVDVKNVEKVPYNSDCHIYFSSYRRQAKEKRWEILWFISLSLHHYFLSGNELFILMLKFVVLDSPDCQRTNEEAFRYCTKSCSSDSDCKSNQKCLCDEDCGMSCVRNSKCACVLWHVS